ncbi:putative metallopeptidase [Robbsia andropogonis]|uniref:putative metallopeptidase n=1 Tax=Robbsia andropogonis TaxID=28092 RepID=UPI003D21C8EC
MTPESPLFNDDHKHLRQADIAYLWATVENKRQMRRVIGQCEEVTFRCCAWQKGRQEQQMEEWYGRVPAYLITLDAVYANECSDLEWCALVEHELFHIAHKQDEFGAPAFTREGLPKLGIRGHGVEEFVGIVRRYGVGGAAGETAKLVSAAMQAPEIGHADISRMCGTCLLRAA